MVRFDDLIGKPFVNGGRSVEKGMDCWGLAMEVCKRYGIVIPDFRVDAFVYTAIDALANEAIGFRTWEEVREPKDEDVPLIILMRIHPKLATHVGIFIGGGKLIHTMKNTGVVISKTSMLQDWIIGYYRYVQDN